MDRSSAARRHPWRTFGVDDAPLEGQRDLRVDLGGPTSLATVERREGDGTWYGRVYMRPDGTLYLRPIVEGDDA